MKFSKIENRIISPNDKSIILRTAVQYGTQVEYDFAFDQYKTRGDTSFLVAMCNSQDIAVLSGYVSL